MSVAGWWRCRSCYGSWAIIYFAYEGVKLGLTGGLKMVLFGAGHRTEYTMSWGVLTHPDLSTSQLVAVPPAE